MIFRITSWLFTYKLGLTISAAYIAIKKALQKIMKNMMNITLAIPGAIPLHQMCYWWRITSANHLKEGWVDTYEPCHLIKYHKIEACMQENLSSAPFSFLQIVMKIWYSNYSNLIWDVNDSLFLNWLNRLLPCYLMYTAVP